MQVTSLQNSGSYTLGPGLTAHFMEGDISASGMVLANRIAFPSASYSDSFTTPQFDSHSIGFVQNDVDESPSGITYTSLNVEAQGGFGGSNVYNGGTLRLLCGAGKTSLLDGNVYIANSREANRSVVPPEMLTVNGNISASGNFVNDLTDGWVVTKVLQCGGAFAANNDNTTGTFQVKGTTDNNMFVGNYGQSDNIGIGYNIADGPTPEKLTVGGNISGSGEIHCKTGSFGQLQAPGAIICYDVSNPTSAAGLDYLGTTYEIIDDTNPVADSNFSFVWPDSGAVEIEFSCWFDGDADTNIEVVYCRLATELGGTIANTPKRAHDFYYQGGAYVTVKWYLGSGTPGETYNWRVEAKADAGQVYARWGGGADAYPPMIIKVTALPTHESGMINVSSN